MFIVQHGTIDTSIIDNYTNTHDSKASNATSSADMSTNPTDKDLYGYEDSENLNYEFGSVRVFESGVN